MSKDKKANVTPVDFSKPIDEDKIPTGKDFIHKDFSQEFIPYNELSVDDLENSPNPDELLNAAYDAELAEKDMRIDEPSGRRFPTSPTGTDKVAQRSSDAVSRSITDD